MILFTTVKKAFLVRLCNSSYSKFCNKDYKEWNKFWGSVSKVGVNWSQPDEEKG
jgi:hypothetical protein